MLCCSCHRTTSPHAAAQDEVEDDIPMINIDLSKALHPRFWDLLPAFMPGLFFEVCISAGDPQLGARLAKQAHMGPYPFLIVAVVVALVVGMFFMHWVRTIQIVLETTMQKRLRKKLSAQGEDAVNAQLSRGAHQAWRRAAARVLAVRYGMEPPDEEEWVAWYAVLWRPTADDIRGPLLVMTTHATGWSGLAAAWVAPELRFPAFFLLAFFLIATGVANDWSRIRWQQKPSSSDLVALHNVLRAIPQPRPGNEKESTPPAE